MTTNESIAVGLVLSSFKRKIFEGTQIEFKKIDYSWLSLSTITFMNT